MCWVRHRPPVPIVSWWGSVQWVNPLQPSIRSAGQSCCCSSSGCNMGLVCCDGSYFFLGWHSSWILLLDRRVGSDQSHTRAHLWSSAVFWTGFVAFWLYAICWRIPIVRFHRSSIEALYFLAMREIFFLWTNMSFTFRSICFLNLIIEVAITMFENRVLRRIFGPKRDRVTGGWRKLHD
jgi:hypothetical protein